MNKGLDLQKQQKDVKDTDWTFGAASTPCIASIPQEERHIYLPNGELQYGIEDFMDCASRSPHNILEAKLNYLYLNGKLLPENRQFLERNGYVNNGRVELSDRYTAIKSGTTRNGNSLVAPLDSIHRNGCIAKSMLPSNPTFTWEQYHNKAAITPAMDAVAYEFSQRFTINYERVREEDLELTIKYDFLDVALYAWPEPTQGIYPRTNASPNHVCCLFRGVFFAFDNYRDIVDQDFIKALARDYKMYPDVYRIFISSERPGAVLGQPEAIISLYQRLIPLLVKLRDALKQKLGYA